MSENIEHIIVEADRWWNPSPDDIDFFRPDKPTFKNIVDAMMKRIRQHQGKITAATLAALFGEIALIGLIEYFENLEDTEGLTPVQKDLYDMAQAASEILAHEESILDLAVDSLEASATSDSLSVSTESTASELQEEVIVDPEVAPVTREIEEVVVFGKVVEGTTTSLTIGAAPSVEGVQVDIPNEGQMLLGGTSMAIGLTEGAAIDSVLAPTTPQEEEINRILGVTPIGTSVDVVSGVSGINTIPNTSIAVSPVTLAEGTGLNVQTTVGTAEAALTESMTPRDDLKPKGLWYLALLRYVGRSFGRITELDDWQSEIKKNVYLPAMRICKSTGQCIQIKAGTPMDRIPLGYQAIAFQSMVNGDLFRHVRIDTDGLIADLFIMELVDFAIGLSMRTERNIVDKAGLRGIFDYGNPSTWIRRFERFTGQEGQRLSDYVDFTDPDVKQWYEDYRRRLREQTGEKFDENEGVSPPIEKGA